MVFKDGLKAQVQKQKSRKALAESMYFLLGTAAFLIALIEFVVRVIVTPIVEDSRSVSVQFAGSTSLVSSCHGSKYYEVTLGITDTSPFSYVCDRAYRVNSCDHCHSTRQRNASCRSTLQ